MDHPAPPVSPTPQHAARPAPRQTESAAPFARGTAPGWTLSETADGIVLAVAGQAVLRFGRGVWRATPAGRTLIATGPGGAMRLRVDHAPCRDGTGRRAMLMLDGRSLPGCLLDTGDRPYDGGG